MNTAHRGVRIAAALAAVIIGATACGSDSKSSGTAAPLPPTKSVAIGGDANQVAPAATAAPAADSTGSGATTASTP
ncbi:MAG: hypothetical protein ACXV98_11080, partial [Ilumatobacteraceae bacterium]